MFSMKVYFNVVVSGDKFAGETTVSADDPKAFQEAASDFFSTLAAKLDEQGEALFVTFEPRTIAGVAAPKEPGKPLPEAPAELNLPNCPFHNVPVKQKNGRNGVFYSCSERKADGGYCNWKPADRK